MGTWCLDSANERIGEPLTLATCLGQIGLADVDLVSLDSDNSN